MANHVFRVLADFGLKNKVPCITGDNTFSNSILGRELMRKLQEFDSDNCMLGCVAHVINLAAKAGLKSLNTAIIQIDGINFEDDANDAVDEDAGEEDVESDFILGIAIT